MRKKWLIDAHNLIHQVPDLKRLLNGNHLEAWAALCDRIQQKCVQEKNRATLVIDGVPLLIPGKRNRIDLRFSRERTADEVIISIISEENASKKWTVVTDDREIRQQAFYYHVDIVRSTDFFDHSDSGSVSGKSSPRKKSRAGSAQKAKIQDPGHRADISVSDEEVDEMLKLFRKKGKSNH